MNSVFGINRTHSYEVFFDRLLEHYELIPGVSVPRSAMYNHYLDHCQELGIAPLNPAGFGKAIRATFPSIKTRRLGNRGASKYVYLPSLNVLF